MSAANLREVIAMVQHALHHNHLATQYAARGWHSLAMGERCARDHAMKSARYYRSLDHAN